MPVSEPICPLCMEPPPPGLDPSESAICERHGLYRVSPAALARLEDAPHLGQIIEGRYALVDLIGGGGMGIVYRARQLTIGRDVAFKILNAGFATKADVKKRFRREAQVLAELKSDYSVKLIDFGFVQQGPLARSPYMVMEAVEGSDLGARLAQGPLPPADVLTVLEQVADALDEAHRKGIVHRDIKPGNLLLTRHNGAPRVKVIDFGIARIDDGELTAPAHMLGTPSYMAPELWRTGEHRPEIDHRVDIYALGVLLYSMLCGRKPFSGGGLVAMATAHSRAPRPPLDAHLAPYEPVVHRAMAIDPGARHPSVSAMAEDFRAAFFGVGAPKPEPTTLLDTLDSVPFLSSSDDTAPSHPSELPSAKPSSLLPAAEPMPGGWAHPADRRSIIPPLMRPADAGPSPARATVELVHTPAGAGAAEPSYSHHVTGVIDSSDAPPPRASAPMWALGGLVGIALLALAGFVLRAEVFGVAGGDAGVGARSEVSRPDEAAPDREEGPDRLTEVVGAEGEASVGSEQVRIMGGEAGSSAADPVLAAQQVDAPPPEAGEPPEGPALVPGAVDDPEPARPSAGDGEGPGGKGGAVRGEEKGQSKRPVEQSKAPAEQSKAPAEQSKAPAEQSKAPAEKSKGRGEPGDTGQAEKRSRTGEQREGSGAQRDGPGETVDARGAEDDGRQRAAAREKHPLAIDRVPIPDVTSVAAEKAEADIKALKGQVRRLARHCKCAEAREALDELTERVQQSPALRPVELPTLSAAVASCRKGRTSTEIRRCERGDGL